MVDGTPVEEAVRVLARLAGRTRALELAIGTGRVAVPLAALGVEVHGIDMSRAMVARLAAKRRGQDIAVTIGDMTSTRVAGSFGLVYLVYNTIQNVTTQAGQVATFRNAAAHLAPGGRFLVECMVPELRRLPPGGRYVVYDRSPDHVGIDEYDVARQGLTSHDFTLRDGAWEYATGPFRYVWPAELDLMAELAGLRPLNRWGGWDRRPFTGDSAMHVSVWEKPA